MYSTSDMDTKLSFQTNSSMLENKARKPLMALANNFSEQHNKQKQKFKGYFLYICLKKT